MDLVLMPQRMSWIIGKMSVIFFKDEHREATCSGLGDDLAETIGVISPHCRFEPRFCTSLGQICLSVGGSLVIPFLPSDGLAHLPHHTDPDNHYELLTKRALARSGLPTLESQLIDFSTPETGWDSKTLDNEIARAVSAIRNRRVPFVLKSNSSGGSMGTYLFRTSVDQATVEKDVTNLLRAQLQELTLENAHLHPCSLILTDFLSSDMTGINSYVRSDGQAQFSKLL
jgi:hypothetical protein